MQPDNYLLKNSHVEAWNLAYGSVCVVPMLYSVAVFLWRLDVVRRRRMHWCVLRGDCAANMWHLPAALTVQSWCRTGRRWKVTSLGLCIAVLQVLDWCR